MIQYKKIIVRKNGKARQSRYLISADGEKYSMGEFIRKYPFLGPLTFPRKVRKMKSSELTRWVNDAIWKDARGIPQRTEVLRYKETGKRFVPTDIAAATGLEKSSAYARIARWKKNESLSDDYLFQKKNQCFAVASKSLLVKLDGDKERIPLSKVPGPTYFERAYLL